MALKYRTLQDSDRPFVFSTWLKSFRRSNYAGPIPMLLYYDTYRGVVEYLLSQPDVKCWICYDDSETDPARQTIYGYAVVDAKAGVLHYAYTKELFRRSGVMRACLKAAGVDPKGPLKYSFKTPHLGSISRGRQWLWDPMLARQYHLGSADSGSPSSSEP